MSDIPVSISLSATINSGDLPPFGGSAYSQRLQVFRADNKAPIFKKGTGNTVLLRAGSEIEFLGVLYAPTSDQTVTLPTLVAGTDYRIAIKTDGTLQAYAYDDTLPTGAKVVGGFHHLIGAPATGLSSGGNTTPTVLEWSMWDIGFRPKCDPRGMTRVFNAGFWIDIYFQGDSSNVDGVSRNDDFILRGDNPPIIPAEYGGDGTTQYTGVSPALALNWWQANEFVRSFGKRLPSYAEMTLAQFGTNEGAGRGNNPVKTGFAKYHAATASSDPNFTSACGVIQSTGCGWNWTSDLSTWESTPTLPALATSLTANSAGWEAFDKTGGRGKLLLNNSCGLTALVAGTNPVYTSAGSPTGVTHVAGSRATETLQPVWQGSAAIGVRGASDHYQR